MTFTRTLLIGTLAWVSAITLLHAGLNWGVFDARPEGRAARQKFRVGFLPVT
jgi:hypothetical protein